MPPFARLPAGPLVRELRRARRIHRVTWAELAERLGVSERTLMRVLAARDIAEPVADRLACRLGLHPALLWPRHWFLDRGAARPQVSEASSSHSTKEVSMQFTVSKKQLERALRSVMPAVGARSTLPVLTGVHIEARAKSVVIAGTDLEATALYAVKEGVTVRKRGSIVTAAKTLAKAIAAMPSDEITVETEETEGRTRATLRAGTRTIALDTYPVEDFPAMPDPSTFEPVAAATARTLADAFARVALCASTDEARPVLTSVALLFAESSTTVTVVATDSYRMGIVEATLTRPARSAKTLLVPARSVKVLAKQMRKMRAPVEIAVLSGNETSPTVCFSIEDSVWTTRLIEGEFPNWRQIVPDQGGAAVEFETDELASVLKAVAAVGNGNGTPVRLSLGEKTTLSLADGSATAIRETLATAAFSPDGVGEIEVAFNPGYLADALRFVGAERTRMWVRDGLKPALIGSTDRRYVLMPVRLS